MHPPRYLQIAAVCLSTLKGLEYLHSVRKIHRDVKAGNILIDENGDTKLGACAWAFPSPSSVRIPLSLSSPHPPRSAYSRSRLRGQRALQHDVAAEHSDRHAFLDGS